VETQLCRWSLCVCVCVCLIVSVSQFVLCCFILLLRMMVNKDVPTILMGRLRPRLLRPWATATICPLPPCYATAWTSWMHRGVLSPAVIEYAINDACRQSPAIVRSIRWSLKDASVTRLKTLITIGRESYFYGTSTASDKYRMLVAYIKKSNCYC